MATIKDVARAAGVSTMTVTRVLNKPESVREETKKRVTKVMESLHYSPNIAAKHLVSNRTGIIDVYIPEKVDLANPFFTHLIIGVSKVLSANMYSMMILRDLNLNHKCDGYIVSGLERGELEIFRTLAAGQNRPLVLFGQTEYEDVDYIDVDNTLGAKLATNHLIGFGHKKIAMINVDENKDYTTERLNGYKQALAEHDLPFDESLLIYAENSPAGGAKAMGQLLKQKNISAVFCATDTIAIGAISEINKNNLSVPEDIAIMGFDGLGHNLLSTPTITSIKQPVCEIGSMLAQSLLDKLNGRTDRICQLIAPDFLEGGSSHR